MAQPLPITQALLLVDLLHRDDQTGKAYLLGTRRYVVASTFPYSHPNLGVFVGLTGGRGEVSINVRFIDGDEERDPIAEQMTTVTFDNPLVEIELMFPFTDLVFPETGDYRVQLFADGEFLFQRSFTVITLENPAS